VSEHPEKRARRQIDAKLAAVGWAVQDRAAMNLGAAAGVAVRELPRSRRGARGAGKTATG
jgi:hypothetical protein